jgi:hypothetical protein
MKTQVQPRDIWIPGRQIGNTSASGNKLISLEVFQNHPDFTLTRGDWDFVMKDSPTISKMINVTRNTLRDLPQRIRPGCAGELQRITKLANVNAKLNGRIRSVTK